LTVKSIGSPVVPGVGSTTLCHSAPDVVRTEP
jgi:hypothetical protein